MTRFWCRGLTLPTTDSDVALVSPVSCCASTSSYPGSTGVSMPEPFRFSSGEEHALRRPFTRPSRRVRRCAGSELLILLGRCPAAPSAAFGVTSPASQGRIPGVPISSVASRIDQLVSWLCLRCIARRRTLASSISTGMPLILPHLWGGGPCAAWWRGRGKRGAPAHRKERRKERPLNPAGTAPPPGHSGPPPAAA